MRLNILLLVLVLGPACSRVAPVAPTRGALRFSGTVSAVIGGRVADPIAGARLTVVEGANRNIAVSSDTSGHYEFTNLDSGRFTVAIAAPGFVSATPVVDLYRDIEANFGLSPR